MKIRNLYGKRYIPAVLLFVGLAAGGYLLGPRSPSSPVLKTIPPLPQHPRIRVLFNHARSSTFTDSYRDIERYGDDLETAIVEAISQAQISVAIAIQELNLPRIARALAERHAAGVDVRLIMENTYTRRWSALSPDEVSHLSERDLEKYREFHQLVDRDRDGRLAASELSDLDVMTILEEGGVPWLDDTADGSRGSGLMHHKFVIVDNRAVITSSANFTLSGLIGDLHSPDSRGNANHLLLIDSPELAAVYRREFELMWGDGPGQSANSLFGVRKPERPVSKIEIADDATVTVHFSPAGAATHYAKTSNGAIAAALGQATQSIDLALFVFSDGKLSDHLRELKQQRSITLRGTFDPGFAFRDYSRTTDMWGVRLTPDCQVDRDRQPWHPPEATLGTPNLFPTDKMHHKFALIDAALPAATVITGSQNWSPSANRHNDENVAIVRSPIVAAHFAREFDRLYSTSIVGVPPFLVERARADRDRCGPIPVKSRFVNLNTATTDELATLPGIGPTLAARIIDARPIRSLRDLDDIEGIGPAKLENLRHKVTW
ncbi:MAG: phospholipase D-like domain-containing protein [Cyanobacteria bacterium P01_D01_bin.123]